jgi:hypothetical protein
MVTTMNIVIDILKDEITIWKDKTTVPPALALCTMFRAPFAGTECAA